MADSPSITGHWLLVRSPASPGGYQATVTAEAVRDPDAAIRAARHACIVEPHRRRHWVNLQILVQRRSDAGWTPSKVEEVKRRFPLDRNHLANFRRSEVSGGTHTLPERPQEFPAHDFSRL